MSILPGSDYPTPNHELVVVMAKRTKCPVCGHDNPGGNAGSFWHWCNVSQKEFEAIVAKRWAELGF